MKCANTTSFSKALLAAGALLAASGAANVAGAFDPTNLSIASRVSTLGVGVELKYRFHEKFNGRFAVNEYDKSYSKTESGNRYKGDLELSTYGLIADWHPMGNGFRLSAGVYSNGNELKARTEGTTFRFGDQDRMYTGNARASVDFKSLAPYIGLGWSSQKDNGWSFDFEVGALFQGDPELRASGSAGDCTFSVNTRGEETVDGTDCSNGVVPAEFRNDIREEHRDLEDDLDDLKVYPVVSIGIQYRF